MQRYFDDWDALDQENTRIWQTYYEPKPLSELYTGWQEMLAEHRQLIVEVQEIAAEHGWREAKHKSSLEGFEKMGVLAFETY